MPHRGEDELQRLDQVKRVDRAPAETLGPAMVGFFKHSVAKRQTRLGKIAECWGRLIPEMLNEHCALESYTRGSLSVIVDSSAHLYELKQLLLAGLEQQLLLACRSSGLKKIHLKAGRWYDEQSGDRKIHF